MVRCYNGKLEFMGNPSRWERNNNIFGYSVREAVEIINNRILPQLVSLKDSTFSDNPIRVAFSPGSRSLNVSTRLIQLSDMKMSMVLLTNRLMFVLVGLLKYSYAIVHLL